MKGRRQSLRKEFLMRTHFSKGGLRKWVGKRKWEDIGAPKKTEKINHAGGATRGSKRKYPKWSHLQKPHG